MQKISKLSDSCPQKDRTESESYAGVQTFMGITENNLTEVQFAKEDLLERILSAANLNKAYKRVISNGGSGGVDKMETEDLLSYLRIHKDSLIISLKDGKIPSQSSAQGRDTQRQWQDASTGYSYRS